MKKKKPKYDKKYIASIIRERNFHRIRDWLYKMVDNDIFIDLIPQLNQNIDDEYKAQLSKKASNTPSTRFVDSIGFVKMCVSLDILDAEYIIRQIQRIDIDAYNVLPYIISNDSEWNYAIRKVLNNRVRSMSLSDGVLFVCRLREAYFMSTSQVSQSLTDLILRLHSNYITEHEGVDSTVLTSINTLRSNKDISILMEKYCGYDECIRFYNKCIDEGARSANLKYPLLKPKYTLGNIWATNPSYFPANIKDYMVVSAYLYMVSQHDEPVEIGTDVYPALEKIAYEYQLTHDDDMICSIISMISKATEKNINNVRFLIPFKDIRDEETQVIIGTTLKKVTTCLCSIETSQTLRDFKYLFDNYKSPIMLSNVNVQKGFLRHGGDPKTLTKGHLGCNINGYIYTPDGLIVALNRASIQSTAVLLQDKELFDIIMNDIIGKVQYYNAIDHIVKAIVQEKFTCEFVTSLIGRINLAYPIYPRETNSARIKISDMKYTDLKLLHYDDVISNIPVYNQGYGNIIQYIQVKKKYVPLHYGLNSGSTGIDRYFMLPHIQELVEVSPGYIGEIEFKTVAEHFIAKASGIHSFFTK